MAGTYQSLEQAFSRCSTTRHNIPEPVVELCELESFLDFGRRHCWLHRSEQVMRDWMLAHTSWNILLVGKDEQQGFLHLSIKDDPV